VSKPEIEGNVMAQGKVAWVAKESRMIAERLRGGGRYKDKRKPETNRRVNRIRK